MHFSKLVLALKNRYLIFVILMRASMLLPFENGAKSVLREFHTQCPMED
jgi:hypothetical protein